MAGDVIPSFLDVVGRPSRFDAGVGFNNVKLRNGEVQEMFYPDHPHNRSKKVIEYRVYAQDLEGGAGVGKMYDYCIVLNPFAGLADKASWTLRPDNKANSVNKNSSGPGKGSKVLLLCVNGEQNNAVILGGLRDQADAVETNIGHNLHLNFNGIDVAVNADGELTIKYGGKTDASGKTATAASAQGTLLKFKKDGSMALTTADGKQALTLDHTTGKVNVAASAGMIVGAGTDAMVKGTSYRAAEAGLHSSLQASLTALTTALAAAGIAVAANKKAEAGAALAAAAAASTAMASSIGAFEAQAVRYLSPTHKLD